ncbi:hypothetical protein AJ79_05996 [Helicocarpus griseus UAMH5409]|uniref:Uncharacterized protein n=1 Tax=Helicocarpus griseus UAMH5409 TaxID=1447875 RepID=A0A2B7XHD1_9EURO|nr:hypothetical protein AJ79_05996 [Helicocarpus griseus UAMH5409]
MGLQLVVDMDKQFSITKTDHNIELTQEDLTTNLSVDDIVAHCYQSGYVTGIFSPNNSNQGVRVVMAVAAQPSHAQYPQTHSFNQQTTADPPKSNIDPAIEADTGNTENHPMDTPSISSELHGDHLSLQNNAALPISHGNLECGNQTVEGPYTAQDFDHELRNAMNEYPIAPDENGYFTLFNPELRDPVYIYNPYRIQSEFDPYDIGDFI